MHIISLFQSDSINSKRTHAGDHRNHAENQHRRSSFAEDFQQDAHLRDDTEILE
jgi:hypothetical protein